MFKSVGIIALIVLAGCASLPPVAMEGTENAVVVNWAGSTSVNGALAIAEQHCAKYGRHAQFVGKITVYQIAYNCVKS